MRLPLSLAAVLALASPALADEGMWTFDNFPAARAQADVGVAVDRAWLDRVQAASVRLTSGCSGSIVSKQGLVLTNYHCVADCVQDLSTPTTDYARDGFLPAARQDERQCPGMQAEVLVQVTDVTGQVTRATAGKSGQDFVRARTEATGAAEKAACDGGPGFRCQAISLYRGGQFKIYKFRKYADVRLAFAPEFATGFFGGDPDNFNFPRFNLDAAFLRLYENGTPVIQRQPLVWSTRAPAEGEAMFVSGNPGTTERLLTVSQLETLRDLALPIGQLQRSELRGRLIQFSQSGPEAKRIAADHIIGLENSFKVYYGRQLVLTDPAFMAAKRRDEADLRAKVAADPRLATEIGDPWAEIAAAQAAYASRYLAWRQLESEAGRGSSLYVWARALVRGAAERAKPSGERLPEFADARLPLEEKKLLDAKPVETALEEIYLEHWLLKTREYLTVDAPAVKALLGRESPEAMAVRLAGSKLSDPAVRKALWEGGMAAVQASDDPLIKLVLDADADARAARAAWEAQVTAPTDRAAEKVAKARFAVYGESVYPDATFSLRLSYGKVAGWTHQGRTITPFTTFAGAYERATGAEPYALTPRWIEAQGRLNPDTVFNFVTTNDITGGNSGSPVIDAHGAVVGAAFDGNIHSLGGAYGFDPALNRTVVVSTAAITEALDKVYGRTALVKELTGR